MCSALRSFVIRQSEWCSLTWKDSNLMKCLEHRPSARLLGFRCQSWLLAPEWSRASCLSWVWNNSNFSPGSWKLLNEVILVKGTAKCLAVDEPLRSALAIELLLLSATYAAILISLLYFLICLFCNFGYVSRYIRSHPLWLSKSPRYMDTCSQLWSRPLQPRLGVPGSSAGANGS